MSTSEPVNISNDKPKARTTVPELVGVIILAIITIVIVLIIIFVIRPKLFSGDASSGVPGIPTVVTCPTSPAPINLQSVINDVSKPSFQASWDAVLTPTTPGKAILGYNVYVNDAPGVTVSNSGSPTFSAIPNVKIIKFRAGSLAFGKTYYWRVQTVDECGPGSISTEEHMTPV